MTDGRASAPASKPAPRRARLLALASLAAGCVSHPDPRVRSQAPAPPPPSAATIEQRVAELERASEPGPEHRALDPLVGEWRTTLSAVAPDGSERELAHGFARVRWVLDGRYLAWDASLEVGGVARETSGFLGYDLRARTHVYFTVTSLSTGMTVARGTGDIARGGIRFELEQADPQTGVVVRMTSLLRLEPGGGFALDQLGTGEDGRERVVQRTRYRPAAASAVTR